MGYHIVTLEERIVQANLQWLLQPSPKATFITEIRMLTLRGQALTLDSFLDRKMFCRCFLVLKIGCKRLVLFEKKAIKTSNVTG
jgi:hypothetical protein